MSEDDPLLIEERGCLNVREAARFLNISPRTLFTITNRKENAIPHLRMGSRVLYPIELLREWIIQQVDKRPLKTNGSKTL